MTWRFKVGPMMLSTYSLCGLLMIMNSACTSKTCSQVEVPSVEVAVMYQGDTDPAVEYRVLGDDSSLWTACEGGSSDRTWFGSCGWEESGRILVRATSMDGEQTDEIEVRVKMDDNECHVRTQQVTLTLNPVEPTAE